MSDLIQIENLSLSYDSDTIIVHEMNLHIQQVTITALVGPNGCGKSTLLRGLSRLLKPVKGNVHLDGCDIHAMKAKDQREGRQRSHHRHADVRSYWKAWTATA